MIDQIPADELLPPQFDPSDWYNAVIGVMASGAELRVDLRTDPHIFIVGPSGSGKSILVQRLAVSALSRGHQVVLIDPIKEGCEYARMSDWLLRTAYTRSEAAVTLGALSAEVDRRYGLLEEHATNSWTSVPGLKPITVIVDNNEALNRGDDLGAASQLLLKRLTQIGQGAGIFLLLTVQAPWIAPDDIRSNFSTRILLPTPRLGLDQLQVFMSGSGASGSDALKLIEGDPAKGMRGLALVSTSTGIAVGQVAFIASDEVNDILVSLGVPKPTLHGSETA